MLLNNCASRFPGFECLKDYNRGLYIRIERLSRATEVNGRRTAVYPPDGSRPPETDIYDGCFPSTVKAAETPRVRGPGRLPSTPAKSNSPTPRHEAA